MRHSDINLTMGIYTHTQTSEVQAAVNALPDFHKQVQVKTGTDDQIADAIGFEFTPCSTPGKVSKAGKTWQGLAENQAGIKKAKSDCIVQNTAFLAQNTTEEEGFEPTVPFGTTVFKTVAISHSATPPVFYWQNLISSAKRQNPLIR